MNSAISGNNTEKTLCKNGWFYEASVYQKTIVTEVSFACIYITVVAMNFIAVGFSLR